MSTFHVSLFLEGQGNNIKDGDLLDHHLIFEVFTDSCLSIFHYNSGPVRHIIAS
jgi:hypothetical protein